MTPARKSSTRARQTPIQSLDDLQPDPLNANRGTDRGREALRRSLRTYGAGRSIVIDKRGRILGGAQDRGTGQAPGAPGHGGAHHRPRTRCGAASGSGRADRPPCPGTGASRQPGRRTRSGLGSGHAAAARTGGRGPGGLLDPRGVCPAPRPGGAGGAARRAHRAGPAHHDHDPAWRRVPTRPPPPRVRGRDGGDGCRPAPRRGHPVPDGDRSPLRRELSAGVSASGLSPAADRRGAGHQ